MAKDGRSRAILATVKNFAHPSAHSVSRAGSSEYSCADSKLALSLLAVLATH